MKKGLLSKIGLTLLGFSMVFGATVAGLGKNKVKEINAASSSSSNAPTDSSYSYTFISGDLPVAGATKTFNSIPWTYSGDTHGSSTYIGFENARGVQLGKGTSNYGATTDMTLSTSISSFGSNKKITKMCIGISCASSGGYSGSFSNGETFSGSSTSVTYYSTSAMNATNGNITFTFKSTKNNKAIYIKAIYVWYTTPLSEISLSGEDITGTNPNYSINISSDDNTSKTIYLSLTPADSTDQIVNISHNSGTDGLVTISASSITCTNGSGNFSITGTGATSGSEVLSICGNSENSIISYITINAFAQGHNHVFDSVWASDSANHWHACNSGDNCSVVDGLAAHTFGEYQTTLEPTYSTTGSKHRYCSVCDYEDIQTIPMLTDYVISVSVSGSMTKTSYYEGDDWNTAGITVTKCMASAPSTPIEVTEGITWTHSPEKANSTDVVSVQSYATVSGVKSTNYVTTSVTVLEKTYLGNLKEGRFFLIIGGHVLKASTFAAKGADDYTTNDSDTSDLLESDAWYFTKGSADNKWYIKTSSANDASYLYTTATNNGLVSGNTSDEWTVKEGAGDYENKLLLVDSNNSRYLSYTTSAGSYIRCYTGTSTGACDVTFVKYVAPATFDSISVTATNTTGWKVGESPTLTQLGATVNANYSDNTSLDVTSSATITSGLPLVKGNNNLTISYTNAKNVTKTATLEINNVVQPVTSIAMGNYEPTMDISTSQQLTVTVGPNDANDKTIVWSSSDTSIATVDQNGLVSATATTGTVSITATANDGSLVSAVANITTIDPTVYVSSIKIEGTADKAAYYAGETFSASGLTVKAVYTDSSEVDVTSSAVWSSNSLISGQTSVSVSYTCDDGVFNTSYSGISVVTKTIQSLTIDTEPTKKQYRQGDLLDLSGMILTAHYQLNDEQISSGYTTSGYDLSVRGDQTVTISYLGKTDSFDIYVTIPQISVSYKAQGTPGYFRVDSVSNLKAGDKFIIATEGTTTTSVQKAATDFESGKTFLGCADATIAGSQITCSSAMVWTLGGNATTGWTIANNSSELLGATAAKALAYDNGTTTWNISIDSTTHVASIESTDSNYGAIKYNSASPRFLNYASGQADIYLYKYSTPIIDDSYTVSENLYDAVNNANELFTCNLVGSISFQSGKSWADVASAFEDVELEEKTKISTAISNQSGNVIEQFLAKYDYIVAKYSYEDFLTRNPLSASKTNYLIHITKCNNNTWIIAVVSLIGITAIGGYFFYKKRKETF